MKKLLLMLFVAAILLVGCNNTDTLNAEVNTTTENTKNISENSTAEKETTTEVESETTNQIESETTNQIESETTTEVITEAQSNAPSENETQTVMPSEPETTTAEPISTDAPIVQVIGTVDNSDYEKVENAFRDIVTQMRADGLVNPSDICVVMDSTSIKVDINFADDNMDIQLIRDTDSDIYTLTLDFDFIWLEGFSAAINNIDPAQYNKELLIALLSIISTEPQTLFDTIDLTYFSSYSLSETEWTAIGDCYMLDGAYSYPDLISYKIKK